MAFKRNKQGNPRAQDGSDGGIDTTRVDAGSRTTVNASTPSAANGAGGTAVALAEDDRPGLGNYFDEVDALDATAKTVSSTEKLAEISRGRLGNLLIKRQLVNEAQLELGLAQQMDSGGRRDDGQACGVTIHVETVPNN